MGIKSKNGMSSVHVNAGNAIPKNPNHSVKILDGKKIVNKPINAHRSNPGFKAGK